MWTCNELRLRAVSLRSVKSKLGRTGESELTERGAGERRRNFLRLRFGEDCRVKHDKQGAGKIDKQ